VPIKKNKTGESLQQVVLSTFVWSFAVKLQKLGRSSLLSIAVSSWCVPAALENTTFLIETKQSKVKQSNTGSEAIIN